MVLSFRKASDSPGAPVRSVKGGTRYCGARCWAVSATVVTMAARLIQSRFGIKEVSVSNSRVVPKVLSALLGLRRGAPPPRRRVEPHPHALPALASLAPVFTHNGPLGLAT